MAELLNRKKSELIANMSHDLRTPLTGLLTLSESQANILPGNDASKEYFSLICDSSKQLHRMFEMILETAKLDYVSDSPEIAKVFSIQEVVHNIIDLYKPSLLKKKLVYQVGNSGQILFNKLLLGYPTMIERILINLVGNAVKFTHEGKISIQYSIYTEKESGIDAQYLLLSVKDTGVGISTAIQSEIYVYSTIKSHPTKGYMKGKG